MTSTLNSKDYVTFARRFVKETVATMDIEELRSLVTNQIHEEIQEGENEYGQSGAFDEMIAWNEDVDLEGNSCAEERAINHLLGCIRNETYAIMNT